VTPGKPEERGGQLTSHAAPSSNKNVLDVRRCEPNPKRFVGLEQTLNRTLRAALGDPVAAMLFSHPPCLVMGCPKQVPLPALRMNVTLLLRRKNRGTLAESDKSRGIGKPSETRTIALRNPTAPSHMRHRWSPCDLSLVMDHRDWSKKTSWLFFVFQPTLENFPHKDERNRLQIGQLYIKGPRTRPMSPSAVPRVYSSICPTPHSSLSNDYVLWKALRSTPHTRSCRCHWIPHQAHP
jgi:hypothetical protein